MVTVKAAFSGRGAEGTNLTWVGEIMLVVPGRTTAPRFRRISAERSVVPDNGSEKETVTVAKGSVWIARFAGRTETTAGGERSWVAKDTLFPSWTSTTHVNALEERIEREVRERVLGLMEGETPSRTE